MSHDSTLAAAAPRAALDDDRLRAWIEDRIAATAVREQPFRHLIVEQIFPPDYFKALSSAWPPSELFQSDRRGRKFDLVPLAGSTADTRAGRYAALPAEARAQWDHFVFTVNRTIVGPRLLRVFADDVAARVARIREAHGAGRIGYAMGRSDTWQPQANVGRFMMRGPGYALRPHVDSLPYLITVLHYFPTDDDGADGTVLYQAERAIDFERCVASGSTEYFDDAGIGCHEVARLPFAGNMLVAFPNALDAAHGAATPDAGLRRVFQYHLSLKGDDEKV